VVLLAENEANRCEIVRAHRTVLLALIGGFPADVKNATYLTHAAGPGRKFDVGFRVKAVE
jgi:hypothetical protein